MTDRKRPGRPPIDPDNRRSERAYMYISPEEKRTIEAEAEKKGLSLGEYIRRRVIDG